MFIIHSTIFNKNKIIYTHLPPFMMINNNLIITRTSTNIPSKFRSYTTLYTAMTLPRVRRAIIFTIFDFFFYTNPIIIVINTLFKRLSLAVTRTNRRADTTDNSPSFTSFTFSSISINFINFTVFNHRSNTILISLRVLYNIRLTRTVAGAYRRGKSKRNGVSYTGVAF